MKQFTRLLIVAITIFFGHSTIHAHLPPPSIPLENLSLDVENYMDPFCFGDSTGFITVIGLDGVPPYLYSIDGGAVQDTGLFENLSAGTYTLTVEDGNSATATMDFTLVDPLPLVLDEILTKDVSCFGEDTGELEISVSGGTSALHYTYSINNSPFQDTTRFVGLLSGIYQVEVMDDLGCIITEEVTIHQAEEIEISLTDQANSSCAENNIGSITLAAVGGQGLLSYSIDGINFQNSTTFDSLSQGDYTATVMDTNSCLNVLDFSIGIIDSFSFLVLDIVNSNCGVANGSINLLANNESEDFSYSIDGSSFQESGAFNGLGAGNYTATAINTMGCTQNLEFTIGQIGNFMIDETIGEVTCAEGSNGFIDLTLDNEFGPYTFAWLGEGTIPDNEDQFDLSAGLYTVTITDINGCSRMVDYELQPGISLTLDIIELQNATCSGSSNGMVILNSNEGEAPFNFSLNGNSNTTGEFSGLAPNVYQISVSDVNGCTGELEITITESESPFSIIVTDQSGPLCNGGNTGAVTLVAENASDLIFYSIGNLTNTSGDFVGLTAGEYTASATDSLGCLAEATVSLTEPPAIELVIDSLLPIRCNGAENAVITYHIDGGIAPYLLSDGIDEIEVLNNEMIFEEVHSAGITELNVTDANGCMSPVSFTITEPDSLEYIVNEQLPASCFGESDAYISFMINGGTAPYNFIVANVDTTVIENGAPLEIDDAEAGTYPFMVVDANGCELDSVVQITQPNELEIINTIIVDSDNTSNGSITVQVVGGIPPYLFALDSSNETQSQSTFNGLPAGTYDVNVIDSNGCETSTTATIITTDVNNISENILTLEVGPNPANQLINIHMDVKEYVNMQVQLKDINGRSVFLLQPEVSIGQQMVRIHTENLDSGLYLINVTTNRGSYSKKIIIQH